MPVELPASTAHRRGDGNLPYLDEEGFVLRMLRIPADIPVLHDWFTRDYATFWLMQDKTADEIQAIYQALMDSGHATAYLGLRDGRPAFMAECYDPFHDRIRQHYAPRPGDLGMHFFVGPAARPVAGYTRSVFRALMRFMFLHLGARRIVVEPDANNRKIHVLNRAMGFVYDRNVPFEEKIASLAFCTRAQFEHAVQATPEEVHS
ncbi:GNAT family N-acetyltransferase [Bordetella petrii]|uniref:GNAT family N-acetyltransferase n=1 Tax=Bordetella petrii TaxID=94624 RepID=A0ABT7W612_9BORD|nr:GNAT family N-acetyltransferase [Bordetella petrii]MDM9560636.1 GNAT family N-acetyltransferase [Bordetella petrii]